MATVSRRMRDTLQAYSFLTKQADSFGEYVRQQIGLGLLRGAVLAPDVMLNLPALFSRMLECERRRATLRAERDLAVPTILFVAITGQCNFHCQHCYSQRYAKEHMDMSLARRILSQAYDLGISAIVVSGGEPLLHEEFFEIPRAMLDVAFMIFTNGALIPAFLEEQESTANMLWLVSIDGPREYMDARRGPGSYDTAIRAMKALRKHRRPFGFSVTMAPDNVDVAGTPEFIQPLVKLGCRSGAFLEQIPSPPCDPPLSRRVRVALDRCRTVCKVPIVGFPADEDRFGGCQAGGDGLAHVSPDGYLEPCPAARLAADSLAEVSFETALSNPFIKEFRELKTRFEQEDQSCAYTGRAETFEAALARYGAHSTV